MLANHETRAKSIVELTTNGLFKRNWSSLYKAIDCFLSKKDTRQSIKMTLLKNLISDQKEHLFFLDTTPNFRPKSHKTDDRTYEVLAGRGVPGFSYSALCLGMEKSWAVPVSMERVSSNENKCDKGLEQFLDVCEKLSENSNKILVADSAYSSNKFIAGISQQKDAVLITRVRSNRKAYYTFSGHQKKLGRNKKYGDRVDLANEDGNKIVFEEKTLSGKLQYVEINSYNNLIFKGSKKLKMSDKAFNLLNIKVLNEKGERKYVRDLAISVSGAKKDSISPKQAYDFYKKRFDIEHFFKFGKTNLLMDKYQTTSSKKDESWHLLGMIAFNLLYSAKRMVSEIPLTPWNKKCSKLENITPFQTYRAMPKLFSKIDFLLDPVVKRGIPTENKRKIYLKKSNQEVVRKTKVGKNLEITIKSTFGEKTVFSKTQINAPDKNNEISKATIFAKLEKRCEKLGLLLVD
ncbi:MAG: transposase [Nanoarchaeota archaeon]